MRPYLLNFATCSIFVASLVPQISWSQSLQKTTRIVVADVKGQPIAQANVTARIITAGDEPTDNETTLETNENGRVLVQLPSSPLSYLGITVGKEHYVPMRARFSDASGVIDAPREHAFELERGTNMVGLVANSQGHPIADAKVALHFIGLKDSDKTQRNQRHFWDYFKVTDAQGKWTSNEVPSDFHTLHLTITHPDYLEFSDTIQVTAGSPKRAIISKLGDGIRVEGVVKSPAGEPVHDAFVSLGGNRSTSTGFLTTKSDDRGRFVFPHVEEGENVVTVISDSWSPELKVVLVEPRMPVVDVTLEPPSRLVIRVVGTTGEPIPSVWIAPEAWRNYGSLSSDFGLPRETDNFGMWIWDAAPKDAVTFSVLKTGMMAIRNITLSAADEPNVLTMLSPFQISGSVRDEETRQPITSFQIVRGQKQGARTTWSQNSARAFTQGEFLTSFSEPSEGYVVRVEANGYKPATSRLVKAEEGSVHLEFELRRGQGLHGVVVSPDSKNAEGAVVIVGTPRERITIRNGLDIGSRDNTQSRTGGDGRFRIANVPETDYSIVVVHPTGFAILSMEELEDTRSIQLMEWGTISGTFRDVEGGRENQYVSALVNIENENTTIEFSYSGKTDRRGSFSFKNVIPGKAKVQALREVSRNANGTTVLVQDSDVAAIDVLSGNTSSVQLTATSKSKD